MAVLEIRTSGKYYMLLGERRVSVSARHERSRVGSCASVVQNFPRSDQLSTTVHKYYFRYAERDVEDATNT
jgi:hypothetical protein